MGLATSKPFLQLLFSGFILTHSLLDSSSKFTSPTSSLLHSSYMPFSFRTSDVCGGPLLSPIVIFFAPISFKCNIKFVSVSLWVDAGKGSAVLKFGLRSTSFPFTGFIFRSSTALLMPVALSEVLIREIFDFMFLLAIVILPANTVDRKTLPDIFIKSRLLIITLFSYLL